MSDRTNFGARVCLAACCWLLGSACEREPVAAAGPKSIAPLSSAPAVSTASISKPARPCPKFPQPPKWGHGSEQFTIALTPPAESRTVELRGTGALLSFGFSEFQRAAECLDQKHVVDYLRSRPRTEQVVNISGQEDRQFHVPVAALLDTGRAAVVAHGSDARAKTVVKSFWTWMGCSGGCRHMGREYRLSVPGDVFFQITDAIAHGRRSPEPTQGSEVSDP